MLTAKTRARARFTVWRVALVFATILFTFNLWAVDSKSFNAFMKSSLCELEFNKSEETPSDKLSQILSGDQFSLIMAHQCASLRGTANPLIQEAAGKILYRTALAGYQAAVAKKLKWDAKRATFGNEKFGMVIDRLMESWKTQDDATPYLEAFWAVSVLNIETALNLDRRKRPLTAEEIIDQAVAIVNEINLNIKSGAHPLSGITYFKRAWLNNELHNSAVAALKDVQKLDLFRQEDWTAQAKWYAETGPLAEAQSQILVSKLRVLDFDVPQIFYREAQASLLGQR